MKGGQLFVPRLHVVDLIPRALDRADDPVNAVAGESENTFVTPLVNSFDQEAAN